MKFGAVVAMVVGILTAANLLLVAGFFVGRQWNNTQAQGAVITETKKLVLANSKAIGANTKALEALISSGTPFRLQDARDQYYESKDLYNEGQSFWLAEPEHRERF